MSESLGKFKSVVSIDARTLDSFKFENSEIQAKNLDKLARKDEFYISYIYGSDILPAYVEVSRAVPEEELKDSIELKLYEELGLDTSLEYKIVYLEITSVNTGKNRAFNVFAVDTNTINTQMQKTVRKTSYLDYITVAPFLLSSLYKKGILPSEGADCFIYHQDEDAFLAIYQGGEYLYYRPFGYSLTKIHETFCELSGDRIDEKSFFNMLTKEGLATDNPIYQRYISELFSDIFANVNDILSLAKRTYGIEHINRIFIGSKVGSFNGIKDYAKSYFEAENEGLVAEDFVFNIAKNAKDWKLDQMHNLMVLTAKSYLEEQDDSLNFTINKRPPAFTKRNGGKFILTFVSALFLSLIYPAVQYGYGFAMQTEYNAKNDEYQALHARANQIRATITNLEKEKEQVGGLLSKENETLTFRKQLLDEIYSKKTTYPMKSIVLHDLAGLLNDKSVKVSEIVSKDKVLVVSVISKSDKMLTELIKNISDSGRYTVTTKEILLDDNKTKAYQSDIKVGIK